MNVCFNVRSFVLGVGVVTPFVLVATFNQVQTSTVVNVVGNQIIGTATQTVTSIQVAQAPTGLLSTQAYSGWILAITMAVVIFAVLWITVGRKTRQHGYHGPSETETHIDRTAIQPEPIKGKPPETTVGRQFCIECSAPLPLGSKFCNKCGTKQESRVLI